LDLIRKAFFEDRLFPFELVYKDMKSPQNELPDHLHDRFEIVYVYSGSGTIFINWSFYDMNAGDLFISPGNTIHRAFPDPYDPVTSTALFFAPVFVEMNSLGDSYSSLYCFDRVRKRKHFKLETKEPMRLQTEAILEQIHGEYQVKRTGYRHAIRLLLLNLLLVLNRMEFPDFIHSAKDIQIGPAWMKESLQYIDQSHVEPGLRLSILAKRASVTAAHFARVFKQHTDMKVTDYINAKRVVRAKELLLTTDYSMATIASECGFDSLPYFHRVFKTIVGATPGAYKRGPLS
jgi:AraC-like DNA-binding protein